MWIHFSEAGDLCLKCLEWVCMFEKWKKVSSITINASQSNFCIATEIMHYCNKYWWNEKKTKFAFAKQPDQWNFCARKDNVLKNIEALS